MNNLFYYCSFLFFAQILLCPFLLREALSQTPQPPEPFAFIRNQHLVSSLNPQDVVGPAARHFQCIQCILWFEISCSFVSFVVPFQ